MPEANVPRAEMRHRRILSNQGDKTTGRNRNRGNEQAHSPGGYREGGSVARASRRTADSHFMTIVAGGQHAPRKCCRSSSTGKIRGSRRFGSRRFLTRSSTLRAAWNPRIDAAAWVSHRDKTVSMVERTRFRMEQSCGLRYRHLRNSSTASRCSSERSSPKVWPVLSMPV